MVIRREAIRRILAAGMLLVASSALLATSPPTPPVTSLDDRATATATLTFDAPVASVRVTFSASDEALWSDDPEITTRLASLYLSATGGWASFADTPSRPPNAPERPIIRLTVAPVDDGAPLEHLAGRLTDASVDLLEACPDDLDCLVEYELLVEWIDPIPGLEVGAEVEASSLIQIEGPVELPTGAEASVAAAEPVAVHPLVLNDSVGGTAVVDADHPLAMWSVVLDASENAIPAPLAWPIEARGSFVATITLASGEAIGAFDAGGVSILLIPEGADEMVPENRQGAVRHAFDPFPGCRPDAPCERRITVVARWFSADPEHAATVDWRLDAGIVYHGDAEPAAGASIETRFDRESFATPAGPVITASAEGLIELDSSDGGISERRGLELEILQGALASELLGGPVPAVTGTVTLQAQSSAPIEGGPVFILANWEPPESYPREAYTFPDPELNGTAREVPIFPAPNCRADRPCTSTLTLGIGLSANDLERLEGVGITVAWKVEVRLQYPPGTQPPAGAALRLADVLP